MGQSPRQFVRALLPLGAALVGCVLGLRAGEPQTKPPVKARSGYPQKPPPPWRPKNMVNLTPQELAARMGFGSRIDGLLRGEPEETERFYWEDGDEISLISRGSASEPPAASKSGPPLVDPTAARAMVRADPDRSPWIEEEAPAPLDFGAPEPALDDEPVTPEEIEASVAEILGLMRHGESDDPQGPPAPGAMDGYLRREGLDGRRRIEQSAAVGFLDTEYSSVANGSTTTESRYLEHHIEISRALDPRSDLVFRNDFLADVLRIRNTSGAAWSRQVDTAGRLGASLSFTHQDSDADEGEVEPDHNLGTFEVSGGRDVVEGLSWDVRAYGSSLDYDDSSGFFLDRELLGSGVTGDYVIGNLELFGRHQVERDTYPNASENDTDRILSQFSAVVYPRWDLEVGYNSSYEREGVAVQQDLDSFRVWTTEGVARKHFGERMTASVTVGKRSQSVDQPSLFLFDNREYYLWPEVDFQVTPELAASVGYRDAAVRNRRELPPAAGLDETIDDREVTDWELGFEYVGRVLDASILGYRGETRHVNGEQEAFASFDRWGFALTAGFQAGRYGRGEFTYTQDREEYTTFAINDNRARTTGARYVVQF